MRNLIYNFGHVLVFDRECVQTSRFIWTVCVFCFLVFAFGNYNNSFVRSLFLSTKCVHLNIYRLRLLNCDEILPVLLINYTLCSWHSWPKQTYFQHTILIKCERDLFLNSFHKLPKWNDTQVIMRLEIAEWNESQSHLRERFFFYLFCSLKYVTRHKVFFVC